MYPEPDKRFIAGWRRPRLLRLIPTNTVAVSSPGVKLLDQAVRPTCAPNRVTQEQNNSCADKARTRCGAQRQEKMGLSRRGFWRAVATPWALVGCSFQPGASLNGVHIAGVKQAARPEWRRSASCRRRTSFCRNRFKAGWSEATDLKDGVEPVATSIPLQQFERWNKFRQWWRPEFHRLSVGAGTKDRSLRRTSDREIVATPPASRVP